MKKAKSKPMPKTSSDSIENLSKEVSKLESAIAIKSRTDFNLFAEYVFGWTQAPFHREWAQLRDKNKKLIVFSANEHGKTSQALAWALWLLGNNPSLMMGYISETGGVTGLAAKVTAAMKDVIEKNDKYQRVFPALKPSDPWASTYFTVARPRGLGQKDFSMQAVGTFGAFQGARIDVLIIDDVLGFRNTLTELQRQHVWGWLRSTAFTRLRADAQVFWIGTAWHPRDSMHLAAETGTFHVGKYPAMAGNVLLWPAIWDQARLDERRRSVGEREFARQMLCECRDTSTGIFSDEALEAALQLGATCDDDSADVAILAAYTGVDLGLGKGKDGSGLTVLTTYGMRRDGMRQILAIDAGAFPANLIVQKIEATQKRWGSRVGVESNATQEFIAQLARAAGTPVVSFSTDIKKYDPVLGVAGLAAEIEKKEFAFPPVSGIEELVREMKEYQPAEHTGDRLMSLWIARCIERRFPCRRESEIWTPKQRAPGLSAGFMTGEI